MEECSWCLKKIEPDKEISEENNLKFFENGSLYSKLWGFFCCEECFNNFFDTKPKQDNKQ